MSIDIKRVLIPNIPYFVIGVYASKIPQAFRLANGTDFSSKLGDISNGFSLAFENKMPSFHPSDFVIGLGLGCIFKGIVYLKGKNAKKYRHGEEHGTARWGNRQDIEPFLHCIKTENVILTQTEGITMNSRVTPQKNSRNKNVLVIGGSGSGKTRFWLKPNLMQMHSSYVVTDPKGSILVECGKMLEKGRPKRVPVLDKKGNIKKDNFGNVITKEVKDKNGNIVLEPYKIKVLNTINFKKSMKYNPMKYIRNEKDILKLVTTFIANTKGEAKGGDDFWEKAEILLYCALIGYMHYEIKKDEVNFATLVTMINSMEVREDDETFQNPIDLIFVDLEAKNPKHFAVRQYKKYKLAAGKTAKSILISCGARLAPFDFEEVRELTSTDELELDMLGTELSALFFIISDTDDTLNFLVSMAYTQLFNLLCEKADDVYGGRLPIHVRCLIDECANIGQIPKLEKLMATIRSREVSACLVLQTQSQLKAIYKDNADTIVGNCDSMVFLGGKEKSTLEELNKMLGKETIDTFNTGDSRGTSSSFSTNHQKLGKDLMSMDELAVMDGGKCIMQLRGVRPFFSDKFDITQHKNYELLMDSDDKNEFKIEEYLNPKNPKSPNNLDNNKVATKKEYPFIMYEFDMSEE